MKNKVSVQEEDMLEIKFPNRLVLLWARERRMKQRKLRNRLQLPVSVLRNFPRERKKLRKSF